MKTLFITVVARRRGELAAEVLYSGPDGAKALAALEAEGQAGKISHGEIYRAPEPWKRMDYHRLTAVGKREAADRAAADADRQRHTAQAEAGRRRHELMEAITAAKTAAEAAGEEFDLQKFVFNQATPIGTAKPADGETQTSPSAGETPAAPADAGNPLPADAAGGSPLPADADKAKGKKK